MVFLYVMMYYRNHIFFTIYCLVFYGTYNIYFLYLENILKMLLKLLLLTLVK